MCVEMHKSEKKKNEKREFADLHQVQVCRQGSVILLLSPSAEM